ncbi:2-oxoglutarate dehydrogenase E1 component [Azohydromonas sp.]|uniref:2-oxoglutarate dehydrogenase E1 component n=1 Tax=Azohydromonas sp. TaxID=1872666 RepID=UPI002CA23275|nr:2-oxoglutarate dehydrogenase E1 component [Azohydromonas sp.]HMM85080.1 2-oxoglutarate dehydrogenase E1 component [Azohydromonas sp.]
MMQQYRGNSYLFGGNASYVEELYEAYLDNPGSVPDNWRAYFDNLQHVPAVDGSEARDVAHAPVVESFAQRAKANAFAVKTTSADLAIARKQVHVQSLIAAYRFLGSRWADLDPLKRQERPKIPELEPAFYDLTESDMDLTFSATNTYFTKAEDMTLREIVQALRETYCGTIGAEFMHITDPAEKRWWQERLESIRSKPSFTAEQKKHILDRLTAAEGLERYLHTKYVGQKRFSLEGGESFIASMDELVQRAGAQGVQEIVIGMAHRGRLNVLVNTLGKMPKDLFAEFEHTAPEHLPAGDVKYHQGFSSDVSTAGGPVHLSLAFNPSHLEIVNPVVEGSVRARQDRRGDKEGLQVLPVLVHGDAAFAGQGVVMETLALAQTRGYYTGGTLHLVINNQIGFTTSDPRDTRSTLYCTDVVKMIEAPVLHVNGDDPEAVVLCTQLAMDYRQRFKKDVVVDIVCFRKLGHNEQDTPSLTQPLMYKKIAKHPGTRKLYGDKLVLQGVMAEGGPDEMAKSFRAAMDAGRHTADPVLTNFKSKYAVDWAPFLGKKWTDTADTALPLAEVKRLAERITTVPANFKLHPLVEKVLADRAAMGRGEINVDWGMGEHLAYASLVASGYAVRLSGEDCGRGTFVHRHAVLHDQNRERYDEGTYVPLANVADNQAPFTVIDSILSEEAVLGFEYGYASAEPNTLTIWEAQFGDFANGAQVVIDQFIASGEVKWGRVNGLVLMLPHGYEGQGPEHSSARLERFLQLCAEHNMQVCQPSTPAQIFHLLRRQMVRMFRKPLVIMTPKSLLRNKDATSPLAEFTKGEFRTVIGPQRAEVVGEKVKRVIVCSGKVVYDLLKRRDEKKAWDVAVVRVEQLYPFPHKAFAAELKRFPNATEVVWCQDEPQNQGAWFFVQHYIHENMADGQKLGYAGRPASASPAVGYSHLHQEQQKALVDQAFGKLKGFVLTK